MWRIHTPHDDAIIILATIANYDIRKILFDNRSSTNVLLYDAFVRMILSLELLRKVSTLLVNFDGNLVRVEGEITLPKL